MSQTGPVVRRRVTAAVTAVLTLTAGTSLSLVFSPPPAIAASTSTGGTAAGPTAGQTPISMPAGVVVMGIGRTGFLSVVEDPDPHPRWTRWADGSTTELGGKALGSPSDIVVQEQADAFILRDMSDASPPVRIERSTLGSSYTLFRPVGATLVMTVPNTAGGNDLHFVDKQDGVLHDRRVTGLPDNAHFDGAATDTPAGMLIARYATGTPASPTYHLALVDIATAAVVEARDMPDASVVTSMSASSTYLAWGQTNRSGGRTVVISPRGGGQDQRIALTGAGSLSVDLLQDWVLYAQTGGEQGTGPNPLYALTALSLKTGATVKVLDDAFSALTAADGTIMAQGGTLAQGEGEYRISLDSQGTPVATMVASSGEPTAIEIQGTVPPVIDLDRNRGAFSFDTTLSRPGARLDIEVVHTASQRRWSVTRVPYDTWTRGPQTLSVPWDGRFDLVKGESGEFIAAYNGAYAWHIKATPLNGIGPAAELSGTFTVTRKPAPHDFSDNGSPDLLVVGSTGMLNRFDSAFRADSGGLYYLPSASTVGPGWQTYDRFAAAGNLGGTSASDIVARDRTGTLWVYEGTGTPGGAPFRPRMKVGGGWQIYDTITAGSDLNSDGRPDLLAIDKTGVLWLYPGTGSLTAPFAPRRKIGGGWQIYDQISAVGDIAGASAGDLVARDKDGVLWLYLGKGDGTFAARTRIGGGWNAYSQLVAVGDANRDGRPDLIGYGAGTTYVYTSTGNWRAPFAPRKATMGARPDFWNLAIF